MRKKTSLKYNPFPMPMSGVLGIIIMGTSTIALCFMVIVMMIDKGTSGCYGSNTVPVLVDSDLGTDDLFAIVHLLHYHHQVNDRQLLQRRPPQLREQLSNTYSELRNEEEDEHWKRFETSKFIHHDGAIQNFTISVIGVSLVTGMQLSLENSVDILQRLQLFTNGFERHESVMNLISQEQLKLPKLYISMDPHGLIPSQSHSFSEGAWYAKWNDKELHMADILGMPPIVNYSHPTLLPVVSGQDYVKEMMNLLKNQIELNQPATILAIGPLTNLARLVLSNQNHILEKAIEKIVIMGGAINMIDPSNTINGAEWNFFCDSTAAEIALRTFSGRIVLFDLKVANLGMFLNYSHHPFVTNKCKHIILFSY